MWYGLGMTTTEWIIYISLGWIVLALIIALYLGRSLKNADRRDTVRQDFDKWRDELNADD